MGLPRLTRLGRPPWVALTCAFVVSAALSITGYATHVFDGTEQATIDARFGLRAADRPGDVVVVGIGDRSLQTLRQTWPLPRRLHAQAIRRLRAAGARGIVYDVQFTEPTDSANDLALYRSLGPDVILATSESDGHGHTNVLGGDANLARVGARAAAANLQGRGSELTRFKADIDGLPTLAVTAARRLAGTTAPAIPAAGALIDFRGPPGTVRALEFSDVLSGRFDPRAVRGRIVVVGATAPTLQDLHAVPTSNERLMTGSEVEANAIWTVLHGNPLRDVSPLAAWIVIALMAAVAPLAAVRLRTLAALAVAVLAGIAYLVAAQILFARGVVVPVVAPLVALALGSVTTLVAMFGSALRSRAQTSRLNDELEHRVRDRTEELRRTQVEIVERLGRAAEWRDADTGHHIVRMSRLCERLGLASGMDAADAELLRHATAMHDVGKIGLTDELLRKPGRYSPDERARMRHHTTIGAAILGGSLSPLLQAAEQVARTHHERWDGGGYPAGLRGEAIPLAGRICAICDVYDALISERPYKRAWSVDEALAEIEREAGAHFDPALVATFLTMREQLRAEGTAPSGRLHAA